MSFKTGKNGTYFLLDPVVEGDESSRIKMAN